MKTRHFRTTILLFGIFLFYTATTATSPKTNFGVYKLIEKEKVNSQIIDSLVSLKLVIEKKKESPVLAYASKENKDIFPMEFSEEGFRLIISANTVDKEEKYYMIIAVKPNSYINNYDVKKTKAKSSNIEIYFNMEGSKKWAAITNDNIEKPLALTIDQKVYSLPTIKAKINNGIAIINDLKERQAKSVSEALNASL